VELRWLRLVLLQNARWCARSTRLRDQEVGSATVQKSGHNVSQTDVSVAVVVVSGNTHNI
jgi:hypothetical protein